MHEDFDIYSCSYLAYVLHNDDQVTQALNWLVRKSSDLEANVVAVERTKEYSDLPNEVCILFMCICITDQLYIRRCSYSSAAMY